MSIPPHACSPGTKPACLSHAKVVLTTLCRVPSDQASNDSRNRREHRELSMNMIRKSLVVCYVLTIAYFATSVFIYSALQSQYISKEAERGATVDNTYLANVVHSVADRSGYVAIACVFFLIIESALYATRWVASRRQ